MFVAPLTEVIMSTPSHYEEVARSQIEDADNSRTTQI